MKRVVILGDTRNQNHFGCDMVMSVLLDKISKLEEYTVSKTIHVNDKNISIPADTDLVIVNGEGTIHHGAGKHYLDATTRFCNIPFILINAVWDSNPAYKEIYNFKYISVRESLSYEQLPVEFENKEIIPDLIFASKMDYLEQNAYKDIGLTDNVLPSNCFDISSRKSPKEVISDFLKYKRICTGRHHGVALCALLKIPFSAWPSNTHKILGMMTDMGIEHHHFKTQSEALENVPTDLDPRVISYTSNAKCKIDSLFFRLSRGELF